MTATHDAIFECGKLCQSCPNFSLEAQPSGEIYIGCESSECGHASLLEQESLDLLDRARDSGFTAVAALLNQHDLWEAAVEVMFMAAGGWVRDARIKFVDEHLAPAIYRSGLPERQEQAA
jgi:hypothetical protein